VPLPKTLARFNRVVTNRVVRLVAGRLPGFAIVRHAGRRTGRVHRTPVNLFRGSGDRVVIALTYGKDTEWVRNVLAAGGCEVETRGRRIALAAPEIVHDPSRALVPRPVARILGVIDVDDFMLLVPAFEITHGSGVRRSPPDTTR
jgi:deazaflavin-dependent oxidoreductase (nitroreductase family)